MSTGDQHLTQYGSWWHQHPNFGTAYKQWIMPFDQQQQWPLNNNWDCINLGGWSNTTLKLAAEKAGLEAENDLLKAELEKLKEEVAGQKALLKDREETVMCLSDCLEETQDELSRLTKQVYADDLELDKLAIHLVENYLDLMDKYPQEEASDVDLAIFVMEQLEEEAEFRSNESLETVDFYENIIRNHGERLKEYFTFTDGEIVYDGLEYSQKLVEVFHGLAHKLCKILHKQGGKEFYKEHIGKSICGAFEKLLDILNKDVYKFAERYAFRLSEVNELKEKLAMAEAVEPIPLSDHDRVPQTSEKQKCSKCSGKGLVKNVFGKYRPCPDC